MADADDDQRLRDALRQLEVQTTSFGLRCIKDASVRREYQRGAIAVRDEILAAVRSGRMTAAEGAARASELRNAVMELARLRTSDLGLAFAKDMKPGGLDLGQLTERYALDRFKRSASQLTNAERATVMEMIIESAGRTNADVNRAMVLAGRAGRGLILVSVGIAIYNISTSDDPGRAAVREGTVAGAGLLGSLAGGAAAGLVCGPGAPVCSAIGVAIGGFLFAFGTDAAWGGR